MCTKFPLPMRKHSIPRISMSSSLCQGLAALTQHHIVNVAITSAVGVMRIIEQYTINPRENVSTVPVRWCKNKLSKDAMLQLSSDTSFGRFARYDARIFVYRTHLLRLFSKGYSPCYVAVCWIAAAKVPSIDKQADILFKTSFKLHFLPHLGLLWHYQKKLLYYTSVTWMCKDIDP